MRTFVKRRPGQATLVFSGLLMTAALAGCGNDNQQFAPPAEGAGNSWCDLVRSERAKAAALEMASTHEAPAAIEAERAATRAAAVAAPAALANSMRTYVEIQEKVLTAWIQSGYSPLIMRHPESVLSARDMKRAESAAETAAAYFNTHC